MTSSSAQAVALAHPLAPEDRSRAEFYALLARLYAEAPDRLLLRSIAGAQTMEGAGALPAAWNRLVAASGAMDVDAGAMLDRPLADLRGELATLGLGRRSDVIMLEDHLSALLETMRLLVAGDGDRPPASVATQRAFFERYIDPWVFLCCGAIRESSIANYYACVAELTGQFMALDRDALAME